jgi:hypothetical protein
MFWPKETLKVAKLGGKDPSVEEKPVVSLVSSMFI